MSKRNIIVIICVIIVLFVGVILIHNKNKKSNYENQIDQGNENYDEETGLYYLKDEETGEIIHASQSEDDLDFYREHPDYNPNPLAPRSDNLRDFVDINAYENQELESTENLEIVGE